MWAHCRYTKFWAKKRLESIFFDDEKERKKAQKFKSTDNIAIRIYFMITRCLVRKGTISYTTEYSNANQKPELKGNTCIDKKKKGHCNYTL